MADSPPAMESPSAMEQFPLELKQYICSFVTNSNNLKPVRLVSKDFAIAAVPYLLPRIYLFNHPDSCTEIEEIIKTDFRKHVTTLVFHPPSLKHYETFEEWFAERRFEYERPDWNKFRPAIQYDDDGDPILRDSQSRELWARAHKEHRNAVKDIKERLKKGSEHNWMAYQEVRKSQTSKHFPSMLLDTIARNFDACPNLNNVIVISSDPGSDSPHEEKKNRMFRDIMPDVDAWEPFEHSSKPKFALWDVLQAVDKCGGLLNSLTIISTQLKLADYSYFGNDTIFNNLKHLRMTFRYNTGDKTKPFFFDMGDILRAANYLETFWAEFPPLNPQYNADTMIKAINSVHLRDCMLSCVCVSEDALVDFLLRHSSSLQQLDMGEAHFTLGSWTSVLGRITGRLIALERVQLQYIGDTGSTGEHVFTASYSAAAERFIMEGGEIPEPMVLVDHPDDGIFDSDPRDMEVAEDGLWRDYDRVVNPFF